MVTRLLIGVISFFSTDTVFGDSIELAAINEPGAINWYPAPVTCFQSPSIARSQGFSVGFTILTMTFSPFSERVVLILMLPVSPVYARRYFEKLSCHSLVTT